MIASLLIANRGEIACRIIRTAQILPGTGRWRAAGVTEGSYLSVGAERVERWNPLRPLEGAPPRAGEDLVVGDMPDVLVQPIRQVRRARKLRKEMSLPEVLLWVQLQKHSGGYRFRKQVPQHPYTLDFACLKARLAIEVDGEAHNRSDQPRKDEVRDRIMTERGFRTLRLPAYEVLKNMEGCVIAIVEACRVSALPNPPRHGEVARSDGGVPAPRNRGVNREVGPLRPLEGAPPRAGEDFS